MAEGLRAGDVVGGYRLESVLGRGGMGVVFLAEDVRLGRQVAVKVIAPERAGDAVFRRRFERESQLAASIEHPNSVAVYEVGETPQGQVYIAMRYVEGTDLRALLRSEQWLEPERAVALVEQVAGALDEAHRRGLVHRDVKPGNVLIGEVGGAEWAYLTDFGATKPAAAAAATDITSTGEWMGTADYASPEQIEGERVDARSDVYSLGCVLYEALTGRIPFERENQVAKLYAHVNDPPPLLSEAVPGLPAGLDGVVSRALAKDRGERYPSAGDLGRAARAALAGESTVERERSVAKGEARAGVAPEEARTRALSRPALARLPGTGRPLLLGAAVAGLVAIVAVVAALVLPADGEPEVVDTIEVGTQPLGISVGQDAVWISDQAEGELVRLDPESKQLGDPVAVGAEPSGVATASGSVWVANSGDGTVSRVDPGSGAVTEIEVGSRPAGIRAGENAVWVANIDDDTVSRIDPRNGGVRTIEVGDAPSGIAVAEGGVWVTNSLDGTVDRILPSSGDVVRTIRVGERPRGVAVGKGLIWVANTADGTVTRINENTSEKVGEPIEVGGAPAGIAVGESWIWVTLERDGAIVRLDPESGEVVGEVPVGKSPRALDVGLGFVWVVNVGGGSVTQIEG